jgi:endonuclease-3
MAASKAVDHSKVDSADLRRRASGVVRLLKKDYPQVTTALTHDNPLELLVATILSAQCTDERVNLVTKDLFSRYSTARELARVPTGTLERIIQSTGFFRNKAKNIKACCQKLCEDYGGSVPSEMDRLVVLPGVGRKTANVVLGTAFGLPTGVVVDTHVARISRRLGLTRHKDPVKIERDLMEVLPRAEWIDFSHRLIHHGRRVCKARRPLCDECSLRRLCPRIGVAGAA